MTGISESFSNYETSFRCSAPLVSTARRSRCSRWTRVSLGRAVGVSVIFVTELAYPVDNDLTMM